MAKAIDGRRNNGGTKGNKGGGRKPMRDEQKINRIFDKALTKIYGEDDTERAKVKFLQALAETQRGQIFIAEHVFGKSPDIVKQTNTNLNRDINQEEMKIINELLESQY